MTSISTTGNLLYSSTAVRPNANFWLYGDGDQDQPIPNWFYSTKQDFLDNVAEVQSNQGKETIVGATAKLNRWQIRNAVIVLYTASPQNLISIAGYNYTEQYRTLAIHSNDGIDMSPISDYPSPPISESGKIREQIVSACRQLPKEGPSTASTSSTSTTTTSTSAPTETSGSESSTITTPAVTGSSNTPMSTGTVTSPSGQTTKSSTTISTTTPAPLIPCQALFIVDGSDLGMGSFNPELAFLQASAQNLFKDSTLQFTAAVWPYGDSTQTGDLPENFVNTAADFNTLVDDLYSTGGSDDVKFVATKLNAWDKNNTVIVLFTASPQSAINDAATTYKRFSATVGISITSPANDMSPLAAITKEFSSNPAEIQAAIRQTCVDLLSATTTTAGSSSTAGTTVTGETSKNSAPLLTVTTETLSSQTSTAETFSTTPILSTATSSSHSTGATNCIEKAVAFSMQSTALTETLTESSSAKSSQTTSASEWTSPCFNSFCYHF